MQTPWVHWVNSSGTSYCGATESSPVSPYAHAVSCPACLEKLRRDTEQRRLAMHRLAVAVERIRARVPNKGANGSGK